MKYGFYVLALVFSSQRSCRLSHLRLKNPEREESRLKIELDAVPSQVQRDFDRYVQDLAAEAQRDAVPRHAGKARRRRKSCKRKLVNPLVLFRW